MHVQTLPSKASSRFILPELPGSGSLSSSDRQEAGDDTKGNSKTMQGPITE